MSYKNFIRAKYVFPISFGSAWPEEMANLCDENRIKVLVLNARWPAETLQGHPNANLEELRSLENRATTDREKRIENLAFFIWLEEGKKDGLSELYWLKSQILYEKYDTNEELVNEHVRYLD